jgi:hypothetical protein
MIFFEFRTKFHFVYNELKAIYERLRDFTVSNVALSQNKNTVPMSLAGQAL